MVRRKGVSVGHSRDRPDRTVIGAQRLGTIHPLSGRRAPSTVECTAATRIAVVVPAHCPHATLQHYGDPERLMATRQAISVRRRNGRIFIDAGLILVLVTIVLTLLLATMGPQLYAVLSDVVAAMS